MKRIGYIEASIPGLVHDKYTLAYLTKANYNKKALFTGD
jgi:hypothetical protein